MHKRPTNFYFLGERAYVHGPTILGAFLGLVDQLEDLPGSSQGATILTCRFREEARENGLLVCWTSQGARPNLDASQVCTTATIQGVARTYGLALVRQEPFPITRRMPYDESVYVAEVSPDGDFGGRGTLTGIRTKKDLIRAIVAFNKMTHDQALRRKAEPGSYRWSFSSVDGLRLPDIPSQDPGQTDSQDAKIELARINVWSIEGNMHSLSQGSLQIPGSERCAFRIGFTGQPK